MIDVEAVNDGLNPSWDSPEELEWDELSAADKAEMVAKRLRGPLKIIGGQYVQVRASDELSLGDLVSLDKNGNAQKWTGAGIPDGIAIGTLTKGNYGWIQTKSLPLY